MATFNIKEQFNETPYWKEFYFHIQYSNRGVARIWVNNRKTKYYAGGYGYCKESAVIAKMINDLLGFQKYGKSYGTNRNLLSTGGVGFDSVKHALSTINVKLERIYSGSIFDVFYFDARELFKDKEDE